MIKSEVSDDPAPRREQPAPPGPQPPRRSNTTLDKYTIPTNGSGQREVLTVVAHQTPVTESQCPTIGVTGQHEVLMVGYYT